MKKLILIAVLLTPGAALADAGRTDSATEKGAQMVCRNIQETGSRLSKRRICMTREEWAEQKRIQRAEIERAQSRHLEPSSN
jgi:hypothetical protein